MQHSSVTDPTLDDWHVIDPLDSPSDFKRNLEQQQKQKQKVKCLVFLSVLVFDENIDNQDYYFKPPSEIQ